MPSSNHEGSGHPEPFIENSQSTPPAVMAIDEFRALDAEGLHAYARQHVDPNAPDPIRPFVRVALELESSISQDAATPLLQKIGTHINEPTISNALATLLQYATDEPVYSHRLTSEQGWTLAANLFKVYGKNVRSKAARVAVASTGINRRTFADALVTDYSTVQADISWMANIIQHNPEAREQLAHETAAMLGPIKLPEIKPRLPQREHLAIILGRILLGKEPSEEALKLYNDTTTAQQAAIVDALSVRYVDRPLIRSHTDEPWHLISALRRYCSGESMNSIAFSEQDGLIPSRVNAIVRVIGDAMTPADIAKMSQFAAEETETLVLDRYERRAARRRPGSQQG